MENKIEIISGNQLNKTIESKHLGKTFGEVLSDFTEYKLDEHYANILDKASKTKIDKTKQELFKLISANDDERITIIKLSAIIIKLAAKYTEDIFLKRKSKEVISEGIELKKELGKLESILNEIKAKL